MQAAEKQQQRTVPPERGSGPFASTRALQLLSPRGIKISDSEPSSVASAGPPWYTYSCAITSPMGSRMVRSASAPERALLLMTTSLFPR